MAFISLPLFILARGCAMKMAFNKSRIERGMTAISEVTHTAWQQFLASGTHDHAELWHRARGVESDFRSLVETIDKRGRGI